MSKLNHTVFVYGTLQKKHCNHHVLHSGQCELVGHGTTVPQYLLFNGGFPKMAAMPRVMSASVSAAISKKLGHVWGEVWRIDDESLMNCDRLEGHPRFYCREKIGIRLDASTRPISAWAYVIVNFPYHDVGSLLTPKDGVLTWNDSVSRRPPEDIQPIDQQGMMMRGRILKREAKR
jgi:gamma-glutamylcyclotransferase (GGCT)/AIG2-like uncharacterized protein YtfP